MAVRSSADVKALHAALSPVSELLDQRRAVYSAAVELFSGTAAALPETVLDNPAVRAHLGAALGGLAAVDRAQLVALDELAGPDATFTVATAQVRVASTAAALAAL